MGSFIRRKAQCDDWKLGDEWQAKSDDCQSFGTNDKGQMDLYPPENGNIAPRNRDPFFTIGERKQ